MDLIKVATMLALVPGIAACAAQTPASLGDSPVVNVRCPSFLDRDGCLDRARRECGDSEVTVLREPDAAAVGEGSTVPIEGEIRYRTIIVRCEWTQ